MKEARIPNLKVDPVSIRLERITEMKRVANDEALAKIKSVTDSWEASNKSIDADIKDEFELIDQDEQAVVEALCDLEENRTKPVKDAFTISGKALSKRGKIGLPNVTAMLLQRVNRKTKPLAKAITDDFGNFVFRLDQDIFGDNDRAKLEVEYQVFSGDGTLLHSEENSLTPQLGGIVKVKLTVVKTDMVSNQLKAGKSVKDSILDSRDLIASRVENMRVAHTALAKMTTIAREELDDLQVALAVAPPDVKCMSTTPESPKDEGLGKSDNKEKVTEKEKGKGKEKEKETGKGKGKSDRPGRKVPDLTVISGIGPTRAKKLKQAKIKDIKIFIATDNQKLTRILGDLDFMTMKKDARVILKKK